MEIEAKYAIADHETFQRLHQVKDLAGYAVAAGARIGVLDRYLDSPDRRLLAAGYSLRYRRTGSGTLQMTLKALGHAEGAVHRREELEEQLSEELPIAEWPQGPLRQRVQALLGATQLRPLFDLAQLRTVRNIFRQERQVAKMSVDEVRPVGNEKFDPYFEVEVELYADGTVDDLATIADHLQRVWRLTPESQSKFERALILTG